MSAVYLAAPYAAREQVAEFARELELIRFKVTSSWLKEAHEINSGTTGAATDLDDAQVSGHAVKDFLDITRSQMVVLFTGNSLGLAPEASGSGGRHVETGFALAKGLPVIVVGEPENVFHRIQRKPGSHGWDVEVVADWHAAVLALVARREAEERDVEVAR